MSVALETRVPLLDHRIVEWSWTLPQHLKTRGGYQKWVLRQLPYRYDPKELNERPKMGFGVPISQWLRGPLKEWAQDVLDPTAMQIDGLIHPESIERGLDKHLRGEYNWEHCL